jgi:hypothetical protein
MPALDTTPAGWAQILAGDPQALPAFCDFLEEQGFPAVAGEARQLPGVVAAMQRDVALIGAVPAFRGERLLLRSIPGGPPHYVVSFHYLASAPRTRQTAARPHACLQVLILGVEAALATHLSPLRFWFEKLTGWRVRELLHRTHGEGLARTVVVDVDQERG